MCVVGGCWVGGFFDLKTINNRDNEVKNIQNHSQIHMLKKIFTLSVIFNNVCVNTSEVEC